MIDTDALLDRLAARRPIFHSEADLQHALAWEIALAHPEARVRLEVPFGGETGRAAMDLIIHVGGESVGFELKYWRRGLVCEHEGEMFRLSTTSADDEARYDGVKDLTRLERAIGAGSIERGYLIAVTNHSGFWNVGPKANPADEAFRLNEGRTLTGEMAWTARKKFNGSKERVLPLQLVASYPLSWRPYSQVNARSGEFRALVVPVTAGARSKHEPPETFSEPTIEEIVRSRIVGRVALADYFAAVEVAELEMSFDEVAALYGPLPRSAFEYQAWWYQVASHPHAVWEQSGYRASPDLQVRRVRFRRI